MARADFFILLILLPVALSVYEQAHNRNGNIVWRLGLYRNRNEVPRPRGLDLEKKHKRDAISEDEPNTNDANENKKSFFKHGHFSLPIGAEVPIGYSDKFTVKPNGKKKSDILDSAEFDDSITKKNQIGRTPLVEKLIGNDPDHGEYKELNVKTHLQSRSNIADHNWGLVWKDPYPNPSLHRDKNGYERSTLEGTNGEGIHKISEEEFDSGLMGRGLGGMRERAQNENLMQGKFAEKISDENDVDLENTRTVRRKRRHIVYLPHIHHYGHHPHHYHPGVVVPHLDYPDEPVIHYGPPVIHYDHPPPPGGSYSKSSAGGGSSSSSSSKSSSSSSTSSSSSSLLNETNTENQSQPNEEAAANIGNLQQSETQIPQEAGLVNNQTAGNYMITPSESIDTQNATRIIPAKKIAKITDLVTSNISNPTWNNYSHVGEPFNSSFLEDSDTIPMQNVSSISGNTVNENDYAQDISSKQMNISNTVNENDYAQDISSKQMNISSLSSGQNETGSERGVKKTCDMDECKLNEKLFKCIECIMFDKKKLKENTDNKDDKNKTSTDNDESDLVTKPNELSKPINNSNSTISRNNSVSHKSNHKSSHKAKGFFWNNEMKALESDRLNRSMVNNIIEDAEKNDQKSDPKQNLEAENENDEIENKEFYSADSKPSSPLKSIEGVSRQFLPPLSNHDESSDNIIDTIINVHLKKPQPSPKNTSTLKEDDSSSRPVNHSTSKGESRQFQPPPNSFKEDENPQNVNHTIFKDKNMHPGNHMEGEMSNMVGDILKVNVSSLIEKSDNRTREREKEEKAKADKEKAKKEREEEKKKQEAMDALMEPTEERKKNETVKPFIKKSETQKNETKGEEEEDKESDSKEEAEKTTQKKNATKSEDSESEDAEKLDTEKEKTKNIKKVSEKISDKETDIPDKEKDFNETTPKIKNDNESKNISEKGMNQTLSLTDEGTNKTNSTGNSTGQQIGGIFGDMMKFMVNFTTAIGNTFEKSKEKLIGEKENTTAEKFQKEENGTFVKFTNTTSDNKTTERDEEKDEPKKIEKNRDSNSTKDFERINDDKTEAKIDEKETTESNKSQKLKIIDNFEKPDNLKEETENTDIEKSQKRKDVDSLKLSEKKTESSKLYAKKSETHKNVHTDNSKEDKLINIAGRIPKSNISSLLGRISNMRGEMLQFNVTSVENNDDIADDDDDDTETYVKHKTKKSKNENAMKISENKKDQSKKESTGKSNKTVSHEEPAKKVSPRRVSIKDALRHFLANGGRITGRHRDEDLSPVEVIN